MIHSLIQLLKECRAMLISRIPFDCKKANPIIELIEKIDAAIQNNQVN